MLGELAAFVGGLTLGGGIFLSVVLIVACAFVLSLAMICAEHY